MPLTPTLSYPLHLSRFSPLDTIVSCDRFNDGFNGWMTLLTNFTEAPDFDISHSIVDKTQWPPVMLSSATYRHPGTHGAMSGAYSLKISTRPVASRYEEPPAPGSMGQTIKRMTIHSAERGRLRFEMWSAYTVEQDRVTGETDRAGLNEASIRSFGAGFDLQFDGHRYFVGARYLNAVNGEMQQRWQVMQAREVTDQEWTFGSPGERTRRGVDPQMYGRRHADGSHDGFIDVPKGEHQLCYNETDCKINWFYFGLTVDLGKREYVELRAQDRRYDLSGIAFTGVPGYARIEGLLNPLIWIENDAARRVFFYVDTVVVSTD